MSAFTYSLFGLSISSEFLLAALPQSDAAAPADVEIRHGRIDGDAPDGYSVLGESTLLSIPKVARFLIRDGREIVIDADLGGSDHNVRLFLLGSAFGALLHQRGLLPLHANAVQLDGKAVAFCGHSGAGKSTIAAWFFDRGARLLADDVCVIGCDPSGVPLAFPGVPRLRLWREALEATGRDAGAYQRSFDALDKFDVPTDEEASGPPLPLAAIYLLAKAGPGDASAITRLLGVEAVEALVANTYRGAYLRTIGRSGDHLAACVRIARAVPIFRAKRVWGFDDFDAQARLLEEHARGQAAPGG